MKFKDRFRLAVKSFTSPQLTLSQGLVARNYVPNSEFQPTTQLRGITYKAIDKIGTALSVYNPIVLRASGDPYVNHPFYNLFRNPNPQQNMSTDWVHLWAMIHEIYGENFIYLVRGERSNKIKEMWLLDPSKVELKFDQGIVIGYVLHKDNGQTVPFLPEEIIHDKRPNPFNRWRGLSVMERAADYINTEITTSTFTLNYMRNNASPSGIVSLPNMSKESFQQFASQWREGYEGPQNAGKTAFLRGGEASFQAVGATLKDVDQKITREMAKDDVLMMFDVPKGLLGVAGDKGLGRTELEALEYNFAKYKLEPMMERLDDIFSQVIQRNTGEILDVEHELIIPEDKDYKLNMYKAGANVWLTINEIRAEEGLEPIKGGDELNPINTVPQQNKSVRVSMKKAIAKMTNEEFRSGLVKTNEIYEIKVKRAISKFASDQEKTVIGKINASSKAFEEWLFELKAESEVLADAVVPIMMKLIEEQAKGTTNFITGEPFVITREMSDLIYKSILKISGVFNQDTYTALERTLVEGQSKGESLVKLKKRVEEVYADAKGYRAERIARTESLRTSNATAEEVYRQNGTTKVAWYINPSACEFCQTFAGKTKEIGSTFSQLGDVIDGANGGQLSVSYSDIETPPLHPNCTCSLIPVD